MSAATILSVAATAASYRLDCCRVCGFDTCDFNESASAEDASFCSLCGFCLLRPVAPKRAPPPRPSIVAAPGALPTVQTTPSTQTANGVDPVVTNTTAPPMPKRAPPPRRLPPPRRAPPPKPMQVFERALAAAAADFANGVVDAPLSPPAASPMHVDAVSESGALSPVATPLSPLSPANMDPATLLSSVASLESAARTRLASKLASADAVRVDRARRTFARHVRTESAMLAQAENMAGLLRRQKSLELDFAAARAAQEIATAAREAEERAREEEARAAEEERIRREAAEEAARVLARQQEEAEFRRREADIEAKAEAQRIEAQRQAAEEEERRRREQAEQEAAAAAAAAQAQALQQAAQAEADAARRRREQAIREAEAESRRLRVAREAEAAAQRAKEVAELAAAREALAKAQRARTEAARLEDERREREARERRDAEAARTRAAEEARRQQAAEEEQRLREEQARLERERVELAAEAERAKEAEVVAIRELEALAEQENAERERVAREAREAAAKEEEARKKRALEAEEAAAAAAKAARAQQPASIAQDAAVTAPAVPSESPVSKSAASVVFPLAPRASVSTGTSSLLSRFASATVAAEESVELKVRARLDAAVRWVDREVRKVIEAISRLHTEGRGVVSGASPSATPQPAVTFSALFEATQDSMEALSGTLMTAKRRGVVSYDGALLLQRVHDSVVITLLKTEIPDTPLPDHSRRNAPPARAGGFTAVQTGAPEKCAVCEKTVYASERVGAASKVYHTTCFRCHQCSTILSATDYCNLNARNYCKTCFQRLASQHGTNF